MDELMTFVKTSHQLIKKLINLDNFISFKVLFWIS